ncbi:3-deoxy-manno-octulosonate cytidylyltransferase [Empedobacter stercoris]|uniref:3-deoxy-manno-octulosonate cytidylyltransferase n=1 Tax=Empedobacter stercoris TaxID=1628248 RepID=UPI001CE04D6A|nr:3-deoxy-manno-octulosonate cytidylyltransferase [Empedobacter stercoris]MCA4777267.1 3-deoxy-manno-octulosonate cytidylyltransferase [Empedobacter stercoris]
MKKIAVIPARYAASRFPGKLMQQLGNKTVIRMTYENVVATNLFDDVFVVTDSKLIFDEIVNHQGKAIMSIKEHETGSDRIAEAIENIECDIILNVQGDEPFVNEKALADILSSFDGEIGKTVDVATLKESISEEEEINNPNFVKVVTDINDFALYFSRSAIPFARESNFTPNYFRHLGIYAFRKNALLNFSKLAMRQNEKAEKLEQLRYLEYGMKIKVIETESIGVGIDTPEDLERAKEYLSIIVKK